MKTTFVAVLMMAASTVAFADEMKCAWGTGSFEAGCDVVAAPAVVAEPDVMKCAWGTASFDDGCDAGVVGVAAVKSPKVVVSDEVAFEMKCAWGTASFEDGCDVFGGTCK